MIRRSLPPKPYSVGHLVMCVGGWRWGKEPTFLKSLFLPKGNIFKVFIFGNLNVIEEFREHFLTWYCFLLGGRNTFWWTGFLSCYLCSNLQFIFLLKYKHQLSKWEVNTTLSSHFLFWFTQGRWDREALLPQWVKENSNF